MHLSYTLSLDIRAQNSLCSIACNHSYKIYAYRIGFYATESNFSHQICHIHDPSIIINDDDDDDDNF